MNGTKFSGISVEVSSNDIHVLPPGHHIRHSYQHACKLCGTETAHVYACCPDAGSAGMCVCYITPAIMYVTIAQLQECWVLMCWISVHVCYTCTRPAIQPLLPQGQYTSLPFPCCIQSACMSFTVSSYQHP